MITMSIICIITYIYVIYRIKKKSGPWDNFDPFNGNLITFMSFIVLSATLLVGIGALIFYLIMSGILP